jgi:hypothetical protein
MKSYGNGGIAPSLLTSAIDGGEWSASRLSCINPWETTPGTHWIRGWVGLRDDLDGVPLPEIELLLSSL